MDIDYSVLDIGYSLGSKVSCLFPSDQDFRIEKYLKLSIENISINSSDMVGFCCVRLIIKRKVIVMNMKNVIFGNMLVAVILLAGCSNGESTAVQSKNTSSVDTANKKSESSDVVWLTDFEQAKKIAAEKKLPILMDFSGSDWCGWCIKLDKEVFSQKAFKDYAKDNLVLFVADFPRAKKQSADVKAQNQALAQKYSIRGFPTVLILDSNGELIAQTGYQRGGAEKYVEYLKNVISEK